MGGKDGSGCHVWRRSSSARVRSCPVVALRPPVRTAGGVFAQKRCLCAIGPFVVLSCGRPATARQEGMPHPRKGARARGTATRTLLAEIRPTALRPASNPGPRCLRRVRLAQVLDLPPHLRLDVERRLALAFAALV